MLPGCAAAQIAVDEKTTKSSPTILTVIDRHSRQIVSTHEVADAAAARALYRSLGDGWDAQICTPHYTDLILSC